MRAPWGAPKEPPREPLDACEPKDPLEACDPVEASLLEELYPGSSSPEVTAPCLADGISSGITALLCANLSSMLVSS